MTNGNGGWPDVDCPGTDPTQTIRELLDEIIVAAMAAGQTDAAMAAQDAKTPNAARNDPTQFPGIAATVLACWESATGSNPDWEWVTGELSDLP